MIHHEEKFLFSCELVILDKLCASKIHWWDRHRTDISIPKGGKKKEEKDDHFQASLKPHKANFLVLENNPLWIDALPSRHTRWYYHPHSWGGEGCPLNSVGLWSYLWNLDGSRLAPLYCEHWAGGGSYIPDNLWIAFRAILPFSWKINHVCRQISILSCPVPFDSNWQCLWCFGPNSISGFW